MATEYRYANSTDTAWADMTPTTRFDDVGVGDTTTGETTGATDTAPAACRVMVANTYIVGNVRLGTIHEVTAFTARVSLSVIMTQD